MTDFDVDIVKSREWMFTTVVLHHLQEWSFGVEDAEPK
jgi:hypothetical protein